MIHGGGNASDANRPPTKRRHMALTVKPNAGHYALAALAKTMPGFLCLSQNVDSMLPLYLPYLTTYGVVPLHRRDI